ncbi:MAG: TIGR01212 family radical SAM protein [Victivallales bacterium]|nr:TIGR01212 family radical SAM protein [Victivallales bacterium]
MSKPHIPYYSFKEYLLDYYNASFYRVPIDLSLSCPHKTTKSDGCIFCAEDGARAVHLSKHLNLRQQVKDGINYIEKRYSAKGNYIAYIQSYTGTNSDVDTLRKLYYEVLKHADFKILIISTRPDCLPEDVLDLLSELNNIYELWIELGVQSANDTTLQKINRGHDFKAVRDSSIKLNSRGIKTVAHIILGLPDETYKNYRCTVQQINDLPFYAYKIHNLLILKKSPLARLYSKANISKKNGDIFIPEIGTVKLMNEFEYAGIIIDLIRRIPENRPLLRLTADADEKNIIGPKWQLSKGQFIELVKNTMIDNGFRQGDLVRNIGKAGDYDQNKEKEKSLGRDNDRACCKMGETENCISTPLAYLRIKTDDDSYTFYNPVYKENYHSLAGAVSEAEYKFIIPSKLKERLLRTDKVKVMDIGFGLGYNALSTLKTSISYGTNLSITSFESDINTLNMALNLYSLNTIEHIILSTLSEKYLWENGKNKLRLIIGDAREKIADYPENDYDIIFLDAFSPRKNPELWTYDFIRILSSKIKQNGILVTYSSAYPVRGAMLRCGFYVGTTKPFGRRKGGTTASKQKSNIEFQLPVKEYNIIKKSTAGTPFRDPELKLPGKKILSDRDKLVRKLRLKGIPKWYR